MNKKKKVLFTATVDSHILQFHIPFLKLFKDKGYEVHVATNGKEQIPYCDVKHTVCFERKPFKINNVKAITQLKKICEKEKFDIIHTHTPMGSVVTRIAAKHSRNKYHTRLIYTAHGFHFFKGAPMKNWLLYYPVEWYLSKYTDTLITINKEDYDLSINKFNKRCKDIQYISGIGVDEKKYKKVLNKTEIIRIREKMKIKEDDFVIIYPARLCKDKNQILLLNLMKRLKEKNIILLLPGLDEYNGFYQSYVKKKHIKNVVFLGKRNDINTLLNISDLVIASSIREGFGINLVEALASGIPVIAVKNRGHNEIVKNGENGFLINNDVNELEEKFYKIYYDKNLYYELKSNSSESVKKYFLTNSIKQMEKIYNL